MEKRRLLCCLLAIIMFCGVIPYVETEAATFVKNPSEARGSDYTDSSKLAKILDEIFAGDIDIYYDSRVTNEVYLPLGSRIDNNHQYTIRSTVYEENKNTSGWQCWIYANAVYNKLFGEWVGQGNGIRYGENVITPGSARITYEMFRDADVKTGAYVRTTAHSNGQYDGGSGHSFIVLSYDTEGLTYIEGNGDSQGLVQLVNRTWDEFNTSQLQNRSRYICHVFQPYDRYYDNLYPTDESSNDTADDPSEGTPEAPVMKSFSDKGYFWPITSEIFSRGMRDDHYAVDISAPTGTEIKSTAGGTVTCASMESSSASHKCSVCGFTGAGYHVMVRNNDDVLAMYAHLSKISVSKGQTISAGQKLGEVGSTGNSTGPHLHFALYSGGITKDHALDPMEYTSPFSDVHVSNITETGAIIHGILGNAGMSIDTAGFYIGTDPNNMTKITEELYTNGYIGGDAIEQIFYETEKQVGKLQSGTKYYYRVWLNYFGKEFVSTLESFTTAGTSAPNVPAINLALAAEYETSWLYRQGDGTCGWGWDEDAPITYPDEGRITLTDGYYAPTTDQWIFQDEIWCGFNAKSPDYEENGYSWITVDLGGVYNLARYTLWVASAGEGSSAGIFAPKEVEFLASDDGVHFDSIGVVRPVDTYDWPYMPITLEKETTARYIKARIRSTTNWMFVSEIEVWNSTCSHSDCEELQVAGDHHDVCREVTVCTDCGAYVSDYCLHETSEQIILKATCAEIGCEMTVCTDCGARLSKQETSYGTHYNKITDAVWGGISCWTETVGYYCRICGEYYEVTYELPGHAMDDYYELIDFQAPTCTEVGYKYFECYLCHTSYVEYLPASEHTVVVKEQEPTCIDYGYHREYCYDCGLEFAYKEYEPTGHDYSLATIVVASCTQDGYTTYTCHCGDSFMGDKTPALGHSFGAWYIIKDVACVEDGLERRDCINCTCYETQVIPATGHTYKITVTVPTCTEQGYTTHTCSCGNSYVDDYVSETGHSFGEWLNVAPGKQERACEACSAVESRDKEVNYDIDGNGTISEADVQLLMSVLVGNIETDTLFDLDFDGNLTIYDCVLIMQQLSRFPI